MCLFINEKTLFVEKNHRKIDGLNFSMTKLYMHTKIMQNVQLHIKVMTLELV